MEDVSHEEWHGERQQARQLTEAAASLRTERQDLLVACREYQEA